jgi:hypothetical protein
MVKPVMRAWALEVACKRAAAVDVECAAAVPVLMAPAVAVSRRITTAVVVFLAAMVLVRFTATRTVLVIGSGVAVARVRVAVRVRLGDPSMTSRVALALSSLFSTYDVAIASAVPANSTRAVSVLMLSAVAAAETNVGVFEAVSVLVGERVLDGVRLGPKVGVRVLERVRVIVGLKSGF